MDTFRVVKISYFSPGYKEIQLIDESLFSVSKKDQEIFAFSTVLPESEVENWKEGETVEGILKPEHR